VFRWQNLFVRNLVTQSCHNLQVPYPNASTALPDNITRSYRKAYYAAVTYTDALIGELLDTVETCDLISKPHFIPFPLGSFLLPIF
jgi:arylsulfatase A-like enzyme